MKGAADRLAAPYCRRIMAPEVLTEHLICHDSLYCAGSFCALQSAVETREQQHDLSGSLRIDQRRARPGRR